MKVFVVILGFLVWNVCTYAFPPDDQIYNQVKKQLKGQGDVVRRAFKRLGHQTVQLESFASLEGDFDLAQTILGDVLGLKAWALKRFNDRPQGGKYFIQISDMIVKPETNPLVTFLYSIDSPIYKTKGQREFRVTIDKTKKVFSARADTTKTENSVIKTAEILIRVFPAEGEPGRLWLYLNGTVELGPWLLYEALPEKMMNGQAAERIQTLVENYEHEEERVRALPSISSQSPKGKTEPSGASTPTNPQK